MLRKITYFLLLVTFGIFAQSLPVYSQTEDLFNSSGLPIPRYVSLRDDKVFVRTGPAPRYPIKWVYKQTGLPVEIIQEFDSWRKIKDKDGEEGWINKVLLSGNRTALINSDEPVYFYKKSDLASRKVVRLEKNTQISLKRCVINWCEAEAQGYSGWVERKFIWGVYPEEEFD